MKKRLYLILLTAAILLVAMAFTACGVDAVTTETTTAGSASNTTTEAPITKNPLLITAYDEPEQFVTLPDLKDITVSNTSVNKLVDDYFKKVLSEFTRTDYQALPENTPAILGDSVNIHYTGRAKDENKTLSESALKGMTNAADEKGYDLVLGSGAFIPGFEEQLIGAKKGDKIAVDVTFPEEYHSPELCGVAVIFDVTVNEVSRATVYEKSIVTLSVSYTLNGTEPNGDIATFLKEHTSKIDMKDLTKAFDDYFTASLISDAINGKVMLETVTLDLTMTAEQAKDFGYDTALSFTATLTVKDIQITPEALSDADVIAYTQNEYTTVKDFTDYIVNYYRVNEAYAAIEKAISFKEIPKDVYQVLYDMYYESSLYQQIGDTSDMTEEELAEALTDAVKATADKFATENATAEWKDRMMMAYLQKKVGYTLTEEAYQKELKDTYDYYVKNQYYMLLYYGISSMEQFEEFVGRDSLEFQFINNAVLDLVVTKISYVD